MIDKKRIRLIVASKNPVKISAAKGGFQQLFPQMQIQAVGVAVSSGVVDQPMSDAETLLGATIRVQNAYDAQPDADFWIGLEGGVSEMNGGLAAFAWIVIRSRDQEGKARTGTFFLPPAVAKLVAQGIELGEADDQVFGSTNSKQEGGAIGLLTNNVVDRKLLYQQAVILALVPFINKQLYPKTNCTFQISAML